MASGYQSTPSQQDYAHRNTSRSSSSNQGNTSGSSSSNQGKRNAEETEDMKGKQGKAKNEAMTLEREIN